MREGTRCPNRRHATLKFAIAMTRSFDVGAAAVSWSTPDFLLTVASNCHATLTPTLPTTTSPRAVPFVELYNDITKSHPLNLEPCVKAEPLSKGVVKVHAAHDQGSIVVSGVIKASSLLLTILNTSDWTTMNNRHLAFGEFWSGSLDNRTRSPLVMGKLMGPRSLRGILRVSLESEDKQAHADNAQRDGSCVVRAVEYWRRRRVGSTEVCKQLVEVNGR